MQEKPDGKPWDELKRYVELEDRAALVGLLDSLPPSEAARAMAHLDEATQSLVLRTLDAEHAASLIDELPDAQASELMDHLRPDEAASILSELPPSEGADLLTEMTEQRAAEVLATIESDEAEELRTLATYPEDSAGGLMTTEFLTFRADGTVADVIADLHDHAADYADYDVQYAYVLDGEERLAGVLRLRDLLVSPRSTPIHSLMLAEPITAPDTATLDELRDRFGRHTFLGLPVVDSTGRILGIVSRSSVELAKGDRAEADHLKAQGIVGGEELRTMPLWTRARRRLQWLSVNVLLNVAAASIIALYQDTLTAVIALAVFLPIISDMSGCSGNQAVAVSMRELTLGIVRPNEVARVWLKELSVGLINGLVLGLLLGGVALLWKGNPWLGLVVGGALAVNTLVAVSLGGMVPLILRRMNLDPALASGPILTTITDMCGFLLVLAMATSVLDRLV